jgi:hypothetical protein
VTVGPRGELAVDDVVIAPKLPLNPHDFGGFEVV